MEAPSSPACPYCGGRELIRLFSPFALLPAQEERLAGLAEEAEQALEGEEPRHMAAWARRMQEEMGEELGPELEEMVEEMEGGEEEDEDWEE